MHTGYMRTYAEFQPSRFDTKGLALPDRQTWYVSPCTRNRDSDTLQESNFRVSLRMLGGESNDVEIHRFGHWACGWFEIVLVRPGSNAERELAKIEEKLDSYPILDEVDYDS